MLYLCVYLIIGNASVLVVNYQQYTHATGTDGWWLRPQVCEHAS